MAQKSPPAKARLPRLSLDAVALAAASGLILLATAGVLVRLPW